jgi:hypothetical protein
MRKVRNKNCYKVYKTKGTTRVFSKCTSKTNAKKQLRLLRAITYRGFVPTGQKTRKNKPSNRTRKNR